MIAGRLISWAAAQHGQLPALIVGEQVFSHAQMEERSNRLAQVLIAQGLMPGERLAVLLDNSAESLDTQFAAEKAGLTYVALNARHTLAEHLAVLADAQVAALIVGPAQHVVMDGVRQALQTLAVHPDLASLRCLMAYGGTASVELPPLGAPETFEAWPRCDNPSVGEPGPQEVLTCPPKVLHLESACALAGAAAPAIEVGPDHLMRIAYTSGTTGQPKGVAYTLERWLARLNNHFLAMEFSLGPEDAMLHVGPLTHAAGVYLFPCFLRGARNVVMDRFEPLAVLQAIEHHRITHVMLVPTMLARLLDAIEAGAKADWSSLRRIHYGTAPTPVPLIQRALKVFGPILRQQYGMTEAVQPLCVLYPQEHGVNDQDAGPIASCGRPTANVRIVLRNASGLPVPAGEVGEITLAHEGVAKVSFWRRPDLQAESVRDGWFYTGDLGRFDAKGFLHIVGRNKDMLISGGFNVYPKEVEDVLASHPLVAECAVLGLPDGEWGEVVAAVVVLRPQEGTLGNADAASVPMKSNQTELIDLLLAWCTQRLAGYKKPRRMVFTAVLPRNGAGKVIKQGLRALFDVQSA